MTSNLCSPTFAFERAFEAAELKLQRGWGGMQKNYETL
jgi:hypothetical protein